MQQELGQLRARLDDLKGAINSNYPEFRTLTQQIDEKEKALASLKSEKGTSTSPADLPPGRRRDGEEIRTATLEPEVSALKAQIKHRGAVLRLKERVD